MEEAQPIGAAGPDGGTELAFAQADLVAAQRAWWLGAARWQVFLRMVLILLAVYEGIILAMTWPGWRDALRFGLPIAAGVALAVTVMLFGLGYLLSPLRARRAFRQHKALAGTFRYRWDADGLSVRHDRGQVALPWTILHAWIDGPQVLLLYQSDILFNMLPKRALTEADVAAIVGHLRRAAVPERRRFGLIGSRVASAAASADRA